MSGVPQAIGLVAALVLIWLAIGIARALRDVLAQRAAGWLLPSDQPITFRLAQLIAILARRLAPRWRLEFEAELIVERVFAVDWAEVDWAEPESAVAELEADLRAKKRVLEPLRLVAPLLSRVLRMHLRNAYAIVLGIVWLPLGVVLLIFVMLIVFPVLRLILREFDD